MPHYEIHHTTPLSAPQYQAIATKITNLHCTLFSAPSAFVNITFHLTQSPSINQGTTQSIFVGGKPVWTNYIIGHLRPRGAENRSKLNDLVLGITALWDKVVRREGGTGASGRLDDAKALHNCFIMEDIAAGAEQGFVLPVAGQDGRWIEENMGEFERRAGDGDESIRALIEEYKGGLGKSS